METLAWWPARAERLAGAQGACTEAAHRSDLGCSIKSSSRVAAPAQRVPHGRYLRLRNARWCVPCSHSWSRTSTALLGAAIRVRCRAIHCEGSKWLKLTLFWNLNTKWIEYVKISRSDPFTQRPTPRRHGYIVWRHSLGRHDRMAPWLCCSFRRHARSWRRHAM
jgi:hypothetical protein